MATLNHTFSPNLGSQSKMWIEKLAHWGYAAKGVVYVLLGILAVMAAMGQSSKNASKEGVAQLIFEQPFGKFLAILVVIGIIGFVIWRFTQAIKDPDSEGTGKEGMIKRIGYFISGLVYAGFAFTLIQMINGSGGSGNSKQHWVAKLLETNAGPILVMLAGIIIMLAGLKQFKRAYQESFMKNMTITNLGMEMKEWVRKIGKIGYAARGIVWLIIGFFFLRAGLTSNAGEVKGSQGAFETIQQSTGNWVLLIVAIGVVAYGVFMFVKARYYQINLR